MYMPRFTAEASLYKTGEYYQGKAVCDKSGAAEVLAMLPRRPTIGCPNVGFKAPTSDGRWICDDWSGTHANCTWDDAYRGVLIGRGIRRVARVAAPIVG